MNIWTIYDNPTDYPGKFVVRRWRIVDGGVVVGEVKVADDLDAARALIPWGAVSLDRNPEDDPVIVESWI